MPKITAHGGPSNASADDGAEVVVQAPIPVAAEEPAEVETDEQKAAEVETTEEKPDARKARTKR